MILCIEVVVLFLTFVSIVTTIFTNILRSQGNINLPSVLMVTS